MVGDLGCGPIPQLRGYCCESCPARHDDARRYVRPLDDRESYLLLPQGVPSSREDDLRGEEQEAVEILGGREWQGVEGARLHQHHRGERAAAGDRGGRKGLLSFFRREASKETVLEGRGGEFSCSVKNTPRLGHLRL